jgi:hypothetical protein
MRITEIRVGRNENLRRDFCKDVSRLLLQRIWINKYFLDKNVAHVSAEIIFLENSADFAKINFCEFITEKRIFSALRDR